MAKSRKRPAPGVHWDEKDGSYKLDLKRKRLRGGRMSISLRTASAKEAAAIAAAIQTVYDRGDFQAIERLRNGEIELGDVRAAVREGDFDRLKALNRQPITVGLAQQLVMNAARQEAAVGTVKQLEYYGSAYIDHFGADTPLTSISADALRAFLIAPRPMRDPKKGGPKPGKPWSANVRSNIHVHGTRMWDMAIKHEAAEAKRAGTLPSLTDSPWPEIARPDVQATRVVFLSPEEWKAVRQANEGSRFLAFVACGALAGLRLNEAGHLRINVDVDMENRVIRIQPRRGKYPWRPKTKRSVRHVPMCDELHRLLTAHIENGFSAPTYLFHAPGLDKPMLTWALVKWTRLAFTRGGVLYGQSEHGKTNHTLRHTFATWLLLNGIPAHVVARLMGDSVMMVMKTYAHLLPENLEQAVTTLDRIVTT